MVLNLNLNHFYVPKNLQKGHSNLLIMFITAQIILFLILHHLNIRLLIVWKSVNYDDHTRRQVQNFASKAKCMRRKIMF